MDTEIQNALPWLQRYRTHFDGYITGCRSFRVTERGTMVTELQIALPLLQSNNTRCCGYRVIKRVAMFTEYHNALSWLQSYKPGYHGYRVTESLVMVTQLQKAFEWLQITECVEMVKE